MYRRFLCVVFMLLAIAVIGGYAQPPAADNNAKALPVVIGFYNLENLFDTINNPLIDDEEFLPTSPKQYNTKKYFDKVGRMATIIRQLGTQYNPDGVALLGCVEVENDTALTDLILHDSLIDRAYQYAHINSPDPRGIDVALLYNPMYFTVIKKEALQVKLPSNYPTRDILYVKGLLLGDTVHVLVNHWPSRRGSSNVDANIKEGEYRRANDGRGGGFVGSGGVGDQGMGGLNNNNRRFMGDASTGTRFQESLATDGEEATRPLRMAAAEVCRKRVDELMAANPTARIIIMGDLNDDPTSPSLTAGLKVQTNPKKLTPNDLYNPWGEILSKGYGTLAFQGKWNLFDQIIFSSGMLETNSSLLLYRNHIFINDELVNKTGNYKGYPKRTWLGDQYNYGYSDHLPVYSVLLKRLEQ
jgi:hypothetical protein